MSRKKHRKPSPPGTRLKADPVHASGVKAARTARRDEAAWLAGRLARLEDAALSARARQGEMAALITAMRHRLIARESRWIAAQDRLAKARAFGQDADRYQARLQRLARMASLVEQTRLELARLEVERDGLPSQIAALDAAMQEVRAALEPGALDAKAAKAGARAMARAREDREHDPLRASIADARDAERRREHDGPTAMQAVRRGLEKTGGRNTAATLGPDVPDAIRRLYSAGKLTDGEVDAAVRYQQDYWFGTDRAKLVGSYEMGVDGSGAGGDVPASRIDAFRRWKRAADGIPVEFRTVLDAVVFSGVSLEAAPGEAIRYASGVSNRRSANGMLLVCALKRLAAYYSGH